MSDLQPGADETEFFRPNHVPKRRSALTTFMIVIIAIVVILAILAVVAELVARHIAENVASQQIESSLPDGTTGQVDVKIHGFSVILQALNGSLDDVSLSSHDLVIEKVPVKVTAEAEDVPLQQGATTGPVDAAVTVDQDALNQSKILRDASANIALGKGTFSYDSSITILGLGLKYKLTAKPAAIDGKSVRLTPTGAVITSPTSSIDVSSLLTYLKTKPPQFCIAKSLPASTTLTKISVVPQSATFHLHSTGLPLSAAGLTEKGTC